MFRLLLLPFLPNRKIFRAVDVPERPEEKNSQVGRLRSLETLVEDPCISPVDPLEERAPYPAPGSGGECDEVVTAVRCRTENEIMLYEGLEGSPHDILVQVGAVGPDDGDTAIPGIEAIGEGPGHPVTKVSLPLGAKGKVDSDSDSGVGSGAGGVYPKPLLNFRKVKPVYSTRWIFPKTWPYG